MLLFWVFFLFCRTSWQAVDCWLITDLTHLSWLVAPWLLKLQSPDLLLPDCWLSIGGTSLASAIIFSCLQFWDFESRCFCSPRVHGWIGCHCQSRYWSTEFLYSHLESPLSQPQSLLKPVSLEKSTLVYCQPGLVSNLFYSKNLLNFGFF